MNLLSLFRVERHYLVFKLDDFGRLDEGCLSCGGRVEHEPRHFLLVGRVDRNQKLAVADRQGCALVRQSVRLSLLQDGVRPL